MARPLFCVGDRLATFVVFFAMAFICPGIIYNESREVKIAQDLDAKITQVLQVSIENVDEKNNDKLIHISGKISDIENVKLSDEVFQLNVDGSMKLKRSVEMLQWQENAIKRRKKVSKKDTKDTTSYKYVQVWSDKYINSKKFQDPSYKNPPFLPELKTREFLSEKVKVGAFKIPSKLISVSITPHNLVSISNDIIENLKSGVQGSGDGSILNGGGNKNRAQGSRGAVSKVRATFLKSGQLRIKDNRLYSGSADVNEVGNYRISFWTSSHTYLSALGKQSGDTIVPYVTSNGNKLYMLKTGLHSADDMLAEDNNYDSSVSWILRFVFIIVLMISINFYLVTVYGMKNGGYNRLETANNNNNNNNNMKNLPLRELSAILSGTIYCFVAGVIWLSTRWYLSVGLFGVAVVLTLFGYKLITNNNSDTTTVSTNNT